jgi:hypothetical protein
MQEQQIRSKTLQPQGQRLVDSIVELGHPTADDPMPIPTFG